MKQQQNRFTRSSIILLLVFLIPLMTAYAETGKNSGRENKELEIPEAGLGAEKEGRWEKAIEVYRHVLSREPRRADILCRGARPRAGLKALAPLLFFDPADYELNTSRILALHYDHRPGEAVDSLEILDRLRPQSYENQYMRNFVWTELRHSFPVGAQYYNDSIGISIFSAYLDGGIRLNSKLRLEGGYTRDFLKAPKGSGFNNINGEESALHFKQWGGAKLRLNRFLAFDGCLGTEKAEELPSRLNMDIGVKAWWFGFKHGGNGYWAPRFFESYMGVTYGYWKLSENDGISFQGEAGVLRANNWDRYRFGYSVEAHGLFGIYRDLLLQLRAAYLHNAYRVNGVYRGVFSAYLFSASLMIRL